MWYILPKSPVYFWPLGRSRVTGFFRIVERKLKFNPPISVTSVELSSHAESSVKPAYKVQ